MQNLVPQSSTTPTPRKTLRIEPAEPFTIRHVALRMRDRDLAEFSAVNHFDERNGAATILSQRYGARDDVWTAGYDEPIAVFGTIEGSPNVISLLFFATDEFDRILLPFTRYVTKELFPALIARGVHRIQCHSISHYAPVHRWLETLGLRREGPILALGKRRETYDMFAMVVPHGSPAGKSL